MSDMRRRGALALLAGMALIAAASTAPGQQSVPSEPAKAAEPVRFSIAIKNRKVDAAQKRIRAKQGDVLELTFTSDEPAELHLHGYNKLVTVAPNAPAVLRLDAKIAGRFPIEAHKFGSSAGSKGGHVTLLYLEVYPR